MTQAPSAAEKPSVTARVQAVVDWLRPIIQADGGDLELVSVSEDGIVQVRFHGACVGCPSSEMTLREGLERNLKEKVPEIRQVVPIGD
jgi:Fe-S cluster biogenesis protein NfuA